MNGEEEVRETKMDSVEKCSRQVVEGNGNKVAKGDILIQSNDRASIQRNSIKDKHQENAKRTPLDHITTATDVEDDEDKAAKVIQSNYRGHRERKRLEGEGKLPERGKKQEERGNPQQQKQEVQVKNRSSIKEQEMGNEEEDVKAAVVIQSNYRGHRERKRLQEENMVPVKTKEIEVSEKEIQELHQPQEEILASEDPDEERAATVIQSNFRGHKERKRLKEERKLDGNGKMTVPHEVTNSEESTLQPTTGPNSSNEDEEQAAVKIQSNYRGFKERKQIQECTEREAEMFSIFSKQITKHSDDFLIIQKKLNDVIASHCVTSKGQTPQSVKKQPNGKPLSQYQPAEAMNFRLPSHELRHIKGAWSSIDKMFVQQRGVPLEEAPPTPITHIDDDEDEEEEAAEAGEEEEEEEERPMGRTPAHLAARQAREALICQRFS
ncbi:myosin-IIIa-like [Heptranchias perlo]|uniref:myosin-IIIa-like n=1 Tax=Heptranchias perlo TaxID=212740 RepID=UPI003559598E